MSDSWQHERKNDPYYKKAKQEEYRSRASYKLKQLNKKFKLIKNHIVIINNRNVSNEFFFWNSAEYVKIRNLENVNY